MVRSANPEKREHVIKQKNKNLNIKDSGNVLNPLLYHKLWQKCT